jgi:release factor glutamine methyltransferase
VKASAVFTEAARRLAAANVECPRREVRLLAALAMGEPGGNVRYEQIDLSSTEALRLDSLVARREAREPYAYIAGRKEFWSLDIAVGPGVLVPRPETETLIEELLREFPDRKGALQICDLGTGSGCLLVSALSEFPCALGLGLERSAEALVWARNNIAKHGFGRRARLSLGDWADGLTGSFDAILANPPYIPRKDVMALTPEVARYEPASALDGGADGLDAYRALAPQIAQVLKPTGVAFLEIGKGQADKTKQILEADGLRVDRIVPDLAGIARCIAVRLR